MNSEDAPELPESATKTWIKGLPITLRLRGVEELTTGGPHTERDLMQFTGSENWYQHSLNRVVLYTDGAKYVADEGGAYWLLDAIAICQRYEKRVAAEPFQVWKLEVSDDDSATLVCEDGNDNSTRHQHYIFEKCHFCYVLSPREGCNPHVYWLKAKMKNAGFAYPATGDQPAAPLARRSARRRLRGGGNHRSDAAVGSYLQHSATKSAVWYPLSAPTVTRLVCYVSSCAKCREVCREMTTSGK